MSINWSVLPILPEIHEWLKENGFVLEYPQSRYPTLDELLLVLKTFDLPLEKEQINENLIGLSLGEIDSDQYAYLLGTIKETGFDFQFCGRSCREKTMLEILNRLSLQFCGALVIYESSAAIPCLVDGKTDIEKALASWHARQHIS